MLCGEIIITNDERKDIRLLTDLINKKGVPCELKNEDGVLSIRSSDGGDALYDLCCAVSDYIASAELRHDILYFIQKNYSCFNADEKELICLAAQRCAALGELAGRLYIYLRYNGRANPHGFYRFMCTDIKRAVLNDAVEEADKLISMGDTEEFVQLLRYFASMSPVSSERVDIFADKNEMRLVNSQGGDFSAEAASLEPYDEDILSELVTLNPQKIVVHGKRFYEASEFSPIINGVFGDRVTYCSGCSVCRDV